jgi:hypothetical protein
METGILQTFRFKFAISLALTLAVSFFSTQKEEDNFEL